MATLNKSVKSKGDHNVFGDIYNYGIQKEEIDKIVEPILARYFAQTQNATDEMRNTVKAAIEDKVASVLLAVSQQTQLTREEIANAMRRQLNEISNNAPNFARQIKLAMENDSIAKAKINLLEQINKPFPRKEDMLHWAEELKKLKPQDFLANFCIEYCNEDVVELNNWVYDVGEYYSEMERVIEYAISKMTVKTSLVVRQLIDHTYKTKDSDLYARCNNHYRTQNKKIDKGVYDPEKQRACFVAYKSQEAQDACQLVNYLESKGIFCFIANRNLQHGYSDAYEDNLRTAIENCSVFILVSSKASRNSEDVVKKEIDEVEKIDKANYPDEFRRKHYTEVDRHYKIPRVEYVIEAYGDENTNYEEKVIDFFRGFDRVYRDKKKPKDAMDEVVRRVKSYLAAMDSADSAPTIDDDALSTSVVKPQPPKARKQSQAQNETVGLPTTRKNESVAEPPKANGNIIAQHGQPDDMTASETSGRSAALRILFGEDESDATEKRPLNSLFGEDESGSDTTSSAPNKTSGTKSLEYKLSSDGTYYICTGIQISSAMRNSRIKIIVDIPSDHNGLPVKAIGKYALSFGCIGFVSIPSSVTSIGNDAFRDCGLTRITIPSSVTSIGKDAFWGNPLETITVEKGNKVYHSAGNCLIETATKTLILGCKTSVIPTDGSVTNIGNSAFYGCKLTNITIPSSVTSIGAYAFYYCGLTRITIPSSVTSIGNDAFRDCGLTRITIPSSVTSIGKDAFLDNPLETITVAKGNKVYHSAGNCLSETATKTLIRGSSTSEIPTDGSVTSIGNAAFRGCKLTNITIPDGVVSIGDEVFYGCELTNITIPSSVTSIGEYAFIGCHLTNVTIPVGMTSIGNFAFHNNPIETVTVEKGNKVYHSAGNCLIETATKTLIRGSSTSEIPTDGSVTHIGNSAFRGGKLNKITIPDGVTSIGKCAFYECGLKRITIPSGVTSIGARAFYGCCLSSIAIPLSVQSIGTDAFDVNRFSDNPWMKIKYEGTKMQWERICNKVPSGAVVYCSDGALNPRITKDYRRDKVKTAIKSILRLIPLIIAISLAVLAVVYDFTSDSFVDILLAVAAAIVSAINAFASGSTYDGESRFQDVLFYVSCFVLLCSLGTFLAVLAV